MPVPPGTRRQQRLAREALEARVQQTLSLLADLRGTLMERLLSSEGFATQHLREIQDALDAAVARFEVEYTTVLQDGQRDAAQHGQAIIDAPLLRMERPVLAPDVTESLLLTLEQTTASLVTKLTTNMQRDLAREVQLGTLGIKEPFQVLKDIEALLRTEGVTGRTGYAARAEAITRTEIGRAQSLATQTRMEDAARTVPGLQKEWRHSGSRNPRDSHVAASGQRRPVREPFLVGGVALMYPRDPAAPASSTVNCRCTAVPYIA